ncbi:MAG: helix-turn-helix domain-containing protein [Agrococcus casei]|uniref:helix-turn-helix domain-containing protein n=1 Tax=Agrococcus casei TaxID=343512 RepID=UPI003F927F00
MPDNAVAPSTTDETTLAGAIEAAVAVVMGEKSVDLLREAVPARIATRLLPAIEASRSEVEGLRRRENELRALFTSARELVGLSDADAVLAKLVERAHDMLGADITYLSEFDQTTRELRVRTTQGSVSAEFRSLVVPPGRGVASAIAESGVPQLVSRYDDFDESLHDASVDAAVESEGIVSLVGVPLLSNEGTLGVLFVAMRQEHTFQPEKIALLSALADHAAVVLQAAGVLRSLRKSEEEAHEALEQLSDHVGERERANAVHLELVRAVLAGGGFATVAETIAVTLDHAVSIVDEHGRPRAEAGDVSRLHQAWFAGELRAAVTESRGSGRAVNVQTESGQTVVAALAAGVSLFGAVLIETSEPFSDVDLRTIERAAQVGALLALSEEAQAEAAHRQQVDLAAELLSGSADSRSDAVARARRLGIDVEQLTGLVAFDVPADRRTDAVKWLARRFEGTGLAGERDGVAVAVVPHSPELHCPDALCSELQEELDAQVLAVGTPAGGAIPQRFDGARRALRLLAAVGVEAGAASVDELLPYAAVLETDQRGLEAFLDDTIGAVRRYDADRGTELLATLHAFVRNGASPTRTARAMTFHPNTILQRLDRLDLVLVKGWRDDEPLFRIGLAIRLDALRRRLTVR